MVSLISNTECPESPIFMIYSLNEQDFLEKSIRDTSKETFRLIYGK